MITVEMWADARERVLTRYAGQARGAAGRLRERAPRFPNVEAQILAEAGRLDAYADACEAAAADPALPTPEYVPVVEP